MLLRQAFKTKPFKLGRIAFLIAAMFAASSPAMAQTETKPLYGGTMVIGLANEPSTLNVAFTTNLPESTIGSHLYNKLIRMGIKEEFLPELATSWEKSSDA